MRTNPLLLALAALIAFGPSLNAIAAEPLVLHAIAAAPPVLRVIVVETADVKAYRHELDRLLVLERTVVPELTIRVWRARYAGAETGTLIVASEVPSLAALAKIDEFGRTNLEYQASMRRLEQLRRIASDSVSEEVTP